MFKKYRLLIILTLPLGLILTGASLLGENHRSLNLVDEFFVSLQNGHFSDVCIDINFQGNNSQKKALQSSCAEQNFLFYLSLKRLLDDKYLSFEVKSSIDSYWLPFITSPDVSINIQLRNSKNNLELENLISAKRHGMAWKLESININDPQLKSSFIRLQRDIDFHKFIVSESGTIRLKQAKINIADLNPAEKQLFLFSLRKTIDVIR